MKRFIILLILLFIVSCTNGQCPNSQTKEKTDNDITWSIGKIVYFKELNTGICYACFYNKAYDASFSVTYVPCHLVPKDRLVYY